MPNSSLKILFVGESWLGSCARSLREALTRRADVDMDEVREDAWFTAPRARWLRVVNKITSSGYRSEFNEQVLAKVREVKPDVLMTYKGNAIRIDLLDELRRLGVPTVNIYPDCSPHAHGQKHRAAVGAYDLVISTKIYHPALWRDVYGYRNRCAFVAQGYDPALHLVTDPPLEFEFDVVMVATYRAEYGRLMVDFARALDDPRIRVAIGGHGWEAARASLPSHWSYPGGIQGRGYVSLLRKGKICVAPLTRDVVVHGQIQPGDVDTTRSYELAAARCFFVHRRTDFAMSLYAESEVPMFDNAYGLAELIRHYLANDAERERMATAAHFRAVPAYSLDVRAATIVELLRHELKIGEDSSLT